MSVSNLLPRIQNIFAKIPKNKEFICDASLAPALPHITTIFIDAKTYSSPEGVLGINTSLSSGSVCLHLHTPLCCSPKKQKGLLMISPLFPPRNHDQETSCVLERVERYKSCLAHSFFSMCHTHLQPWKSPKQIPSRPMVLRRWSALCSRTVSQSVDVLFLF
jgi:hypothetical protein